MSASLDEHLFGADRDQIAADDWTDQDLLTKDEAGARIRAIIGQTEEDLAHARTATPERVAELEIYLRRLSAVLANYEPNGD